MPALFRRSAPEAAMHVAKHKVVSINYTLKDDAGAVLDSSTGGDPLAYIHGIGNLVPGLERELEGKQAGDKLKVSIAAQDGYGERDAELVQQVPKRMFDGANAIEPGMRFHAMGEGGVRVVTVTRVVGDMVTVDGNHPLAGQTLHFDVEVMAVRDATREELDHGHVHGPDGHHHH
jgi:FKBP-type peptidyl-prolyl cis-trans isomerase SlyD